jgi:hypothetical protein
MPDLGTLGLTAISVIDDVSPVLPRFRLLWWSENQGLCFFDPKTYFATHFLPKNLFCNPFLTQNTIETMTNPFMALKKKPKKPPKKPNSTQNQKSTRVQICFFINF